MSFFNNILSGSKQESSFGANMSLENKSLSKELVDIGDKFVSTNKKYVSEIEKYKKIVEFNKRLSNSYIGNLKVMVDVSKLLNDYATLFEMLKQEISKTEQHVGTLTSKDIEYLADLTRAKLEQFNQVFVGQSKKVKDIYIKYDQGDEANRITQAEESIKNVMDDASKTISVVDVKAGGKKVKTAKTIVAQMRRKKSIVSQMRRKGK